MNRRMKVVTIKRMYNFIVYILFPDIINHIKKVITRFFLLAIRFLLKCCGNDLNGTHWDEANIKICQGLLSYIYSKLTSFTEMFWSQYLRNYIFHKNKLLNVPLVVFLYYSLYWTFMWIKVSPRILWRALQSILSL